MNEELINRSAAAAGCPDLAAREMDATVIGGWTSFQMMGPDQHHHHHLQRI